MGFQTPQHEIPKLLEWVGNGTVQLPDFQRSYKWDDDRIRELLVTVLRGHPMGVIMTLETGNDQVRFKPKPIEGVTGEVGPPEYLLLDGQQRMTSLYQALTGNGVVETKDSRGKRLRRKYFIDVEKALAAPADQDQAIVSVPEDGKRRENIGRDVVLDVSTTQLQQESGLMPLPELFGDNPTRWLLDYADAVPDLKDHRMRVFATFNDDVVTSVRKYKLPAIELDKATTKEAVATVFEKVNTGGLPLNVFELLTATFAGDAGYYAKHGTDFRLAEDWARTEEVLKRHPVISGLQRSDFLQVITLLATRERRQADIDASKSRPSATSARREDVLRLTLDEYLTWADQVRNALVWVASFFRSVHIHSAGFVPYRTQMVPLAALRTLMGESIDVPPVLARIRRWYWCGVLGELYGGAIETRFSRDIEMVPAWAQAAITGTSVEEPTTIRDAGFRESRLHSLRSRQSAAYKGIYALLMTRQIKDWQYDRMIDHATYDDMRVDIHHIFPTAYAKKADLDRALQDSIVNKTPLGKGTNIFLSGRSPADYLPALESKAGITAETLNEILRAHLVDPDALRAADFEAFIRHRRDALVRLVEDAMDKPVARDIVQEGGEEHGEEDAESFEVEPTDPESDDEDEGSPLVSG